MMGVEVTENGASLQSFFSVTEAELSKGLTDKVLLDAARSDTKELADWAGSAKWTGMAPELGHHLAGFLQDDTVDIFAGVWGKCYELKQCIDESRTHPRDTTAVALTDHDFTYELKPTVDVLVDGVRLGAIPFAVSLTCQVSGLELQVRNGGIAGVRTGAADAVAEITCATSTVWHRDLGRINLPGRLKFKGPVRI
jgi:hypothetical protein